MQLRTPLFLAFALLCPACAPEDDLEFRDTSTGGIVFNTHQMEDARFSELRWSIDEAHQGVALESITLLEDIEVASFKVEGGDVYVVDGGGRVHTGDSLVDSDWTLGSHLPMPRNEMRLAKHEVVDGAPRYTFMHEVDGKWVPNCPAIPGKYQQPGAAHARLLNGFTLDEMTGDLEPAEDNTYIACSTGATGKATEWGYYDVAMAEGDLGIFETAIRVVRADYCYDGVSHTATGLPVWLEDIWNIQVLQKAVPGLEIEAVWGRDGLICRGKGRHAPIPFCGQYKTAICAPGSRLSDYPGAMFMTFLP